MAGPILIVDDDPVQRRLLEAAVTRFGYPAVMAPGGEDALAVLETEAASISAIILDLVMPGLDGIGVLEAMRRRGISIPVIVQTAKGGIDTVVSAVREGSFDFVVKSPPASVLLKKAAALAKGAATPGRETVGKVTKQQVREIARLKSKDLNAGSEEAAMRIVEGTARSCGIQVEN